MPRANTFSELPAISLTFDGAIPTNDEANRPHHRCSDSCRYPDREAGELENSLLMAPVGQFRNPCCSRVLPTTMGSETTVSGEANE
jgi:hypothetical protein